MVVVGDKDGAAVVGATVGSAVGVVVGAAVGGPVGAAQPRSGVNISCSPAAQEHVVLHEVPL